MVATDFDYIATRNVLIKDALGIVGALHPSQPVPAYMQTQAELKLQLLVKHWSNKHLFLWSYKQSSFATVAAQEAYTTTDFTGDDDQLIGLDKAFVVDSTEDLPLEVISFSRYQDIQDKESSGRPTTIAFTRGALGTPLAYLYPSPDDVYTIKTLGIYPLKDFDTSSGSGDLSAQFQLALLYGLADLLFDSYPGPMNERQWVKAKAAEYFTEAQIQDAPRETTSEIEPLYPTRRC